MAATVGWESEVSLRVRRSLGISWNSLSSLAFLAASLINTNKAYADQLLAEMKKKSHKVFFRATEKKKKLYIYISFDTCLDSVRSSMKCSNRDRWSS